MYPMPAKVEGSQHNPKTEIYYNDQKHTRPSENQLVARCR